VPRRLRLPLRERLRADGRVEIPLDPASLDAAIAALRDADAEAVAICLLHAWRDPRHERAAGEAVRAALPGTYVTLSSDVLPQIKEFERFSTTIANAAVGPVIGRYLGRLQERLDAAGFHGPLFVILSHGGVAPSRRRSGSPPAPRCRARPAASRRRWRCRARGSARISSPSTSAAPRPMWRWSRTARPRSAGAARSAASASRSRASTS
jgi:hypothetical protein